MLARLRPLLRPAARACSAWAPANGDRVLLRGLLFHAHHGVLPAETALGQKFCVDVSLSVNLAKAGASDDLHDAVDYAAVYDCVRGVVQGPPRQLVETVAAQVAEAVLAGFPAASAVAVRVCKPHVAIPGALHSLGVEIYRERQ